MFVVCKICSADTAARVEDGVGNTEPTRRSPASICKGYCSSSPNVTQHHGIEKLHVLQIVSTTPREQLPRVTTLKASYL